MVNSVSANTVNVLPPQEYEKYQYEVNVNGKKETASVERTPDDKVTIKVGDGENVQTIETDTKGLMDFNKEHTTPAILYNYAPEENNNEKASDWKTRLREGLKALALTRVALPNTNSSSANQQMIDQQNIINMLTAQQALQDHMTAVQMTTPGMGIVPAM